MSNEAGDVIWSMENNSKGETVLTVFGVPIGSPQELAALVRDARRYREIESSLRKHACILFQRFAHNKNLNYAMEVTGYGNTARTYRGNDLGQLVDALPEVGS